MTQQAQREGFIAESRKRLIELWGLTKDQADMAHSMMLDAMNYADAHREGQEDGNAPDKYMLSDLKELLVDAPTPPPREQGDGRKGES